MMRVAVSGVLLAALAASGCVSVTAPREINVQGSAPRRVDTSRVPPTRDHQEARARLAEAYDRLDYLENKVKRLETENERLENERDHWEERYEAATSD